MAFRSLVSYSSPTFPGFSLSTLLSPVTFAILLTVSPYCFTDFAMYPFVSFVPSDLCALKFKLKFLQYFIHVFFPLFLYYYVVLYFNLCIRLAVHYCCVVLQCYFVCSILHFCSYSPFLPPGAPLCLLPASFIPNSVLSVCGAFGCVCLM